MRNNENKRMEDFKNQDWVKEQNRKNKLVLEDWIKEAHVRSTLRKTKQENIKS